jgi:hypothetical protein
MTRGEGRHWALSSLQTRVRLPLLCKPPTFTVTLKLNILPSLVSDIYRFSDVCFKEQERAFGYVSFNCFVVTSSNIQVIVNKEGPKRGHQLDHSMNRILGIPPHSNSIFEVGYNPRRSNSFSLPAPTNYQNEGSTRFIYITPYLCFPLEYRRGGYTTKQKSPQTLNTGSHAQSKSNEEPDK